MADTDAAIEQRVAEILADVRRPWRRGGDQYSNRFRRPVRHRMGELELKRDELKFALRRFAEVQRRGQATTARVRRYHEVQKQGQRQAGAIDADGPCWARRSRRWTGRASTVRAARRHIRRAC